MTAASLRALTRKALAAHAKKNQIAGWHEMTKDELVAALAAVFRRRKGRNGTATDSGQREARAPQPVARRSNGQTNGGRSTKAGQRTLGGGHLNGHRLLKTPVGPMSPAGVRDSLVAVANDPCWIQVRWTLSRDTLLRAEAALGTQWYRSLPILRVFDVTGDDSGTSTHTRVRDVEIHGDVDHWYLPVQNSPRTYRVQIGYRSPNGLFFVMAQSNRVQTPRPGSHSLQAREGSKPGSNGQPASPFDLERKPSYDLRAIPSSKRPTFPAEDSLGPSPREDAEVPLPNPIEFQVHAELIVHGTTDPHAELTLLGDRVPVSRDGTFSHRVSLIEGRQVIDAVATTRNGCHQRTIVLGIERNTKELEPQWFDEINS